jgi:iron(III) transport system permease protein
MPSESGARFILLLLVLLLFSPVVAIFGAIVPWGQESQQAYALLLAMAQTVLPQYMLTTLLLCMGVAVGVLVLGLAAACAVTLFDFPLRRFFEWALLLPMAMPAYVLAYAYTDFLQFSGPLQVSLREWFGWEGRLLPEVRSVAGAVVIFSLALYPYVYLLARTALSERAAHLMEAARLMGAPLHRRLMEVALPLARPALVAGVALALMETLADFGVSSYFGIQTFTAGIYKAWLAMDDHMAAAQLASMLLFWVVVLLVLEQRAQQRMRFVTTKGARSGSLESRRIVLRGRTAAWVLAGCSSLVLLGFILPIAIMAYPLWHDWDGVPWPRFLGWAWNSFYLASLTAVLAVGLALALAFAVRRSKHWMPALATRLASVGYAVPGAVVVVGLLVPVGWLQHVAPTWQAGYWVTATVLGVLWAYLVRFTAVALQSVQSGYARIPASLDESARMLGASNRVIWLRVHWPMLQRSVWAALLLVFVDTMKELPATLVLRPFNTDTLAVVAYQLARDERLAEAALPSLALVLVGLLPVMLLNRSMRFKGG